MILHKKVLAVLLLLFLGLAAYLFFLAHLPTVKQLSSGLRVYGISGVLGFILLGSLLASCAMPRQVIAVCAGFTYGVIPGFLLALTCAFIGCTVNFYIARHYLKKPVQKRFFYQLEKLNHIISAGPFLSVLTVRFFPAGQSFFINLVAGVSSIAPATFLIASCLGQIPQNLIFAMLGSGLDDGSILRSGLSASLFLISVTGGFALYKRYPTRHL